MTKHKENAIQPERDRSADQLGAPGIEVTPEMIEAGARVLYRMDIGFGSEESFAEQVYVAMETVRAAKK
jgi:hypothetical protein